MWIFRYFLPGIFLVALGGFVFQNLDQKIAIRFLFWDLYNVPLTLILAVTFLVVILIRYYAIFVRWMDIKRSERETSKIVEAQKAEVSHKIKKDNSESIEEFAEEGMSGRIKDEETNETEIEEK